MRCAITRGRMPLGSDAREERIATRGSRMRERNASRDLGEKKDVRVMAGGVTRARLCGIMELCAGALRRDERVIGSVLPFEWPFRFAPTTSETFSIAGCSAAAS